MALRALALIFLTLAATPAGAAGKFPELESCYQTNGQLEETMEGGKKITRYKSEADVSESCNVKVLAKAKGLASLEGIKELASIIGRHSNWQSAVPVYTEGAKTAAKKAVCPDADAWRAADLALSSPAGHSHSTAALAFFEACWDVAKKDIVEKLDASSDAYQKEHLCKFLKGKKALVASQERLCKGSGSPD